MDHPAEPAAVTPEIAGFGRRQRALAIDILVLGIVKLTIQVVLWGIAQLGILPQVLDLQPGPPTAGTTLWLLWEVTIPGPTRLASLIALGIAIVYFTLCESSRAQATLGKLWVGLKVTDRHGRQLTFGQALLRAVGKVLPVLPLGFGLLMPPAGGAALAAAWTAVILLGLSLLLLVMTPRKQALHDLIAGILVMTKC